MAAGDRSGASPYPCRVRNRSRTARRVATVLTGALLSLTVVTGCGSDSGDTNCGLDGCTVTLKQGVDAGTKVLGVEAKLVATDGNKVTVEVAGQRLSLAVGQPAVDAGAVAVSLDSVSDSRVVIRVKRK